jgi:hypothetical protein
MESLAPSPYRYGSESAISQLPRFNDLGLFSEFAYANTVLEEPAPVREPRLRIENEYSGIGFVGDIGALDHRPARGELSQSVHLQPLLERARGEVAISWAAAPDVIAGSIRSGIVKAQDDGWRLTSVDGSLEIDLSVDTGARRRCAALGFTLHTSGSTRLELRLGLADGTSTRPRELKLPGPGTYAALVEFDPSPQQIRIATLTLSNGNEDVVIHDLFVMTYG